MTMDKLQAIRCDLVRNDPHWEDWNLAQLTEALRLWTRRNPVSDAKSTDGSQGRDGKPARVYQTQQARRRSRSCVYCDADEHKASDCVNVISMEERKKILASKKLYFNCTGSQHRAADCKSTATCKCCQKRHHTSICDSSRTATPEGALTAHQQGNKEVVYPIVLVEIDGIRTHALLDTGARMPQPA